jgi:predicted RND superfamily exporter protein
VEAFARLVTQRSGLVLLVALALTVFALSRIVDFRTGELHLVLDPSLDRLLPEGDEGKKFYDHVRRIFGSDETLLIALIADEVFTIDVLQSVARMTERIEEVDGVHHVVSLSTALNIQAVGEDLDIRPFLSDLPQGPADLKRIREEALSNPIYSGNLVSEDARATALLVYFVDMSEREFARRGIDGTIARIAEEERGDAQIRITGPPHIKVATSQQLLSDLVRTLPICLALVALVSLVFFQTVRGVLVPLLTISTAIIWTFGVIAWSGRALNLVTTIVPPLILTIGFAYTVHVLTAYYDALRGAAKHQGGGEPMYAGLRHVALPVLLTGVTTIVGFLALMLSPMGAIREFGFFSVVGISSALLVTLTLTPALLQVLGVPKRIPTPRYLAGFNRIAERLGRFNLDHRTAIFAAGIAVTVVAVAGITQLETTSDVIENFREDHPVRQDFEAVNHHLQGSNPFYIVVQTDYSDAFTEPVNLRHLQDLQEWLGAQPEVGGTTSLVDYLMLINRGFHENDPAYLAIPESQDLTEQLLMFGTNREIRNFVDSRYRSTSILVRSKVIDSGAVASLVDRIEERLMGLPEHLHARVTGNSVLLTRTVDDIARGQVESLGAALVVIYGILVLLFTSFRIGFIALIPNVLPVVIFFGAMGLSGVHLTATTSLIACIVLGIAVDDSIHYLARFNADSRELADEKLGTISAIRSVAQPITVTTVAVCLGFLALTLSELRNQVQFGALASGTLAAAWLVDVTLTPALCSRLRIVSLWDVVTLDLGPDAHTVIPLFRGLTRAQARMVALIANVVRFPQGHRVLKAGDPGHEMFVVIDGELAASVTREDGRVELGRLRRGDAFGEAALFHGKRTADVDAVSDVRVLRVSRTSLERLSRRYPRIALKVTRNLSEILADRLATGIALIR